MLGLCRLCMLLACLLLTAVDTIIESLMTQWLLQVANTARQQEASFKLNEVIAEPAQTVRLHVMHSLPPSVSAGGLGSAVRQTAAYAEHAV